MKNTLKTIFGLLMLFAFSQIKAQDALWQLNFEKENQSLR